jgi:hypothetical protein
MLSAPHAITGATIGASGAPLTACVPLAVASHFLLDLVPHWQETLPPYTPHRGTWVRVPVDLVLSVILIRRIARARPKRSRLIWISACGALVPDLDTLLYAVPGLRERVPFIGPYLRWHISLQHETSSLWGLAPQIGVVLGCLSLLSRNDG